MAGKVSAFAQFKILLGKDLRHEMRTHEMLTSMGLYAVLVLIIFGVAFAQLGRAVDVAHLSGGLVWVLIVFTSLLGLGRSFSYEKEASCIEGILLVPMDRSVIYLSKLVSNLIFLSAVEVIALPLFYFFFMTSVAPAPSFPCSIAPIVLGSIGISAVGTLLSSITVNARSKDVLLAVLLVPVVFPLLYACVASTTAALVGAEAWVETFRTGVLLAGAYDIVMTLASWVLCDFVISS